MKKWYDSYVFEFRCQLMREEYERGQLLRINYQELTTEEWAEIKKSHPGIKYLD